MNLFISNIGRKFIRKSNRNLNRNFNFLNGVISLGYLLAAVMMVAGPVYARGALTLNMPFSAPIEGDDFQKFLEGLTATTNIFEIDAQGLAQGKVAVEPWAGSYWPIYQGILGNRYASAAFPKTKVFNDYYSHYITNPASGLIAAGQINTLSPSEKYDLLIGDASGALTHNNWQRGLDDLAKDGGVATWTGICHGWSAVTHIETAEPQHSVKVMDVTGTYLIEFYAHDIKGLLSYLWAQSSPPSVQAGQRCRQDVVEKDPYLRPIDPTCLDSNPMSWHLAIVNRVGIYKKSFVMDSSSGPEVWNYPIAGYDFSYFNPTTFESSHSLRAAVEPLENLSADKFSASRDPRTKFVVGIIMDVFHPALISPRTTNSNGSNVIHTEKYIYDLELDENYAIIGGEWYSKEHPDFMWTFPAGSIATTSEDLSLVENWDGKSALPQTYAQGAIHAAQRGKVLSKITNALFAESLTSSAAAH
ncbi:MAG: hypothetical protein H7061_04000 [Bdellovibrionaceae bacterium]|nr:hypothetical protein [Bdellovibrio sp.]